MQVELTEEEIKELVGSLKLTFRPIVEIANPKVRHETATKVLNELMLPILSSSGKNINKGWVINGEYTTINDVPSEKLEHQI